jgi:hypothetical protein
MACATPATLAAMAPAAACAVEQQAETASTMHPTSTSASTAGSESSSDRSHGRQRERSVGYGNGGTAPTGGAAGLSAEAEAAVWEARRIHNNKQRTSRFKKRRKAKKEQMRCVVFDMEG